jgi:hypothetical protein
LKGGGAWGIREHAEGMDIHITTFYPFTKETHTRQTSSWMEQALQIQSFDIGFLILKEEHKVQNKIFRKVFGLKKNTIWK